MMHLEANVKEKAVSEMERDQLHQEINDLRSDLKERDAENDSLTSKVDALSQALQNYSKSAEVELKIL